MDDLERLAELIRTRNRTEGEITAIIGRPAQIGHLGEYIAAKIFSIRLHESAVHKGSDGEFTDGPLAGCSVNIKWYARCEGILDINPAGIPDYYLVLAGPRADVGSSRGRVRPWVIESVFLFDALKLTEALRRRGVKLGIATSVAQHLWEAAEIYPEAKNGEYSVTEEQRKLLSLFRGDNVL